MAQPSVVFFGYGPLGRAGLDTVVRAGARVAAAVVPGNRTGPDVDVVRALAERHGIAVWVQPPRASIQPFEARLREAAPDLILVCSYTMLLPDAVLRVPRLGAVNVHGGLLPQYRGPHVTQWAIINGERETGVTLHYMDGGFDTGPIIAQRSVAIAPDADAVTVRDHLIEAATALLSAWWQPIIDGSAPRVPQDERLARYWPRRGPADGAIDWSAPAESIVNLVRALVAPWPGAFTHLGDRRVVVRAARVRSNRSSAVPGQIISADADGVVVATGGNDLVITRAETDGRPIDLAILREPAGAMFSAAR